MSVIADRIVETTGNTTPVPSVSPQASATFVRTSAVEAVTQRALAYLECGYAVHLAGPAGTGKTTLAFHIAAQLGRPVTLLHGNDEFGSSDLIGKDAGYRKSTLVDNYIRSVLKTEENVQVHWMDNRLTTACERGHTIIYDEFNRSRPEANNTLLSILEEGILNLPKMGSGDGYIRVHPDFRAIFTSNPEEYAGVHKTQDALLDRLVTIQLGHYDERTESEIAAAKSGLSLDDASLIVQAAGVLRGLGSGHRPTVRSCIALARVASKRQLAVRADDEMFMFHAWDIFGNATDGKGPDGRALRVEDLQLIFRELAGSRPASAPAGPVKRRGQ